MLHTELLSFVLVILYSTLMEPHTGTGEKDPKLAGMSLIEQFDYSISLSHGMLLIFILQFVRKIISKLLGLYVGENSFVIVIFV